MCGWGSFSIFRERGDVDHLAFCGVPCEARMRQKRLNSLDLFSGIGGITHALRGLCTPIGYCDWNADSIAVLKANMTRGTLPRAPVSDDVRNIDASWLRTHGIGVRCNVDIVVGGFPCVGFSPMGSRQGVENEETGLFFEIMRILDLTHSPYVFLENVPNLLTLGMDVVTRELGRRGYEIRWCVVSAAQMGAPHERRRWFCLGVKQRRTFTWNRVASYSPFRWHRGGPSRTIPQDSARARVRTSLLGNSVVPDAVRSAFLFLLGRCRPPHRTEVHLEPASTAKQAKRLPRRRETYPSCGILQIDGVLEVCAPPPVPVSHRHREPTLVFDPRSFRSKRPASPLLTSGLIRVPMTGRSWATPRHGMLRACNYLTARSIRDLPTQIRFERSTIHRHGGVSPEFVEWMMGYPRGWTRVTNR